MLKIRNVTKLLLGQQNRFFVSDKFMKERDQAAERVYISRQQKENMKKLLQKLSEQKQQDMSKDVQFQRRLTQILRRYKIDNNNFAQQVINIHKQY